ncbi:MAG: glycosyltransferase family 1 protein [Bacteroidales bacterium]|nr:glycosyltransferase family 1 protein [Bacteroidales bacterium]
MPDKHLHIISFDIPYPPNYGGVIDVYYKIRTLHRLGIKIHLHCFEYPGRDRSTELNSLCEEVFYYPRKTGLRSAFSFKPYIVTSRKSEVLMANLLKDDYPVLFEGLHSCYYIDDPRLRNRMKIYRESNIEHRYYFNLFKVDANFRNRIYFLLASAKLRLYQKVLRNADLMLAVSQHDTDYLQQHFPGKNIYHLPSFHANNNVSVLPGKGDYALYHGNIEVPENEFAATYLVTKVFDGLDIPLIIAGMKPRDKFVKLAESRPNIMVVANPDDEKMFDLIRNAQVNILVTFQATGLKLKLLNTLYNGRFCLVNEPMIKGTSLDALCETGNTSEELRTKLKELFSEEFTLDEVNSRAEFLKERYDNLVNGQRMIGLIYKP